MNIRSVDIRPGVSVLSVLRHLNYRPWFAIAEFVDNAIQSYQQRKEEIIAVHGRDFVLEVALEVDSSPPGQMLIRDNAGGIAARDYPRAFRAAAIPPDTSGLSEFGMGMKSAACWFSSEWTVRSSAIGEESERTIHFNISKIVNDDLSELEVVESKATSETHYTEIVLRNLHKPPVGRTLAKIKDHLADIYREFLRNGTLRLKFDGEYLSYEAPRILSAPFYLTPNEPAQLWRKDIAFDFGVGQRVFGFAALREVASVSRAGFALFRRGRLIQGSADEGYRPEYIFGKSNSYAYQRVFGELHLDGFEVSHTKDGFRWDENEQPFLELLREQLDSGAMPLLRQANGHRVRIAQNLLVEAAGAAVDRTVEALQRTLPGALEHLDNAPPAVEAPESLPVALPLKQRDLTIHYRGQEWNIRIELTNEPSIGDWLSVAEGPSRRQSGQPRHLSLRLSVAHPFMVRFAGVDAEQMEALLRVAAALAIGEVLAREGGVRLASTLRRNINDLLRESLSKP